MTQNWVDRKKLPMCESEIWELTQKLNDFYIKRFSFQCKLWNMLGNMKSIVEILKDFDYAHSIAIKCIQYFH